MPPKKRPASSVPSSIPDSRPAEPRKNPAPSKPATPGKTAAAKPPRAPRRKAASRQKAPANRDAGASAPLRVLVVTSEAHPFAKTGGLAEVAAALPAALARLGHDVTVVLPRYQGVSPDAVPSMTVDLQMGPRTFSVRFVEETTPDGVHVVLVDVPELFDRPGLYGAAGRDFPDNGLRFATLSRAALEYARLTGVRFDVIHAHDWQTGLVPVYQKMQLAGDPVVGGVPVVFTIHNLAFQGVFGRGLLDAVGLGHEVFQPEALEYWGNVSLLKGGINFAEKITTVSPTYAREILTPELGFGLDGALRRRSDDLSGILNGIDTVRWDPSNDHFVPPYSSQSLQGKREAKRALLQAVGLPHDAAALARPVIGLISRLTDQKGFDLVGRAADELLQADATWVMLGSGEPGYEALWRTMASRHPGRVSATIGFDERLAHLIEAGADMFLMPSRFEPCGLNQLYSLRYGTVPIVRATGGLADTVVDAAQPGGNGIKFAEYTPEALAAAVRRALDLFADTTAWERLQRSGMARDSSWDVSAREYVKVYRALQRAEG